MKKNVIALFLSFFLILYLMSFQCWFFTQPFRVQAVKDHIAYLSSNHFKGRLAGTLENEETAAYVRENFIKNKLLPFEGSYEERFEATAPRQSDGIPSLTILSKHGAVKKELQYGKDYKEDMLNFKISDFQFSKGDHLLLTGDSLQVKIEQHSVLFYIPEKNALNFRSSFMYNAENDLYIMVTKQAFSELKQALDEGCSIKGAIPYETYTTSLRNITAFLPGKDAAAPPILLTAHFDHVGTDLERNVFSGALDNASGISFVLELSRYLSTLGRPDRSILFVGFNAEEFGCVGSEQFVKSNRELLKGSKVYNFDMVGSDKDVPLCLVGGKKDTSKAFLLHSVSETCTELKVSYNYLFEDSSDHEAFRNYGIDAVTLLDEDFTTIHTPEDTLKHIKVSSIDRCYQVASREVIKYAYSGNPILQNYTPLSIISSLFSVFFIFLFFLSSDK